MKKILSYLILLILVVAQLAGCTAGKDVSPSPSPSAESPSQTGALIETTENGLEIPEWSKNATMYEVNIRQYTEEGTIKAFQEHLPRLQEMGVKILWFMPVHPISVEERKGTLGSYYSISDYKDINPEFGTKEDFKELVDKCHEMGFKVIMDLVANHTGWDHDWVKNNPDWYTQDANGEIVFPETWQDVADLNFDNADMRAALKESILYWVEEYDVDGFRCDYAGGVPLDFWEDLRISLNEIKPVFMLAEDNRAKSFLIRAFNANYGWDLFHDMNSVAKGQKNAENLKSFFRNLKTYPEGAYPLNFIDNHDENSWNGTVNERMGEAQQAMLTLIMTSEGMPLVYSGQEVNLSHRLQFFEKDQIIWDDFVNEELLTNLIHLKLDNSALWNGNAGGAMEFIDVGNKQVLAYSRTNEGDKVVVILNLSKTQQTIEFSMEEELSGEDLMSEETITFNQGKNTLEMEPWGFLVVSKRGQTP